MKNSSQDEIVLSVVLLTYNHAKYIRKCLESIISQKTSFRFELIIGDDASDDNTADIVLEYAALYSDLIIPVIRKQNVGAVKNLADLLKVARGRYISGCEGDDYWTDEQKLEIQFNFLENHPEYIACSHDIIIIDENGSLCENQKLNWITAKRHYQLKDYKGIMLPGHPVALVFRNIFKNDENPNSLLDFHDSIADRTIVIMLAVRGNIYRINREMAAYRKHSTGGKNLTNSIYNDFNSYLIDYRLNEKIEKYIYKILNKKIIFSTFRWKLFFKSTIKTVLKFSDYSLKVYFLLFNLHIRWVIDKFNEEGL